MLSHLSLDIPGYLEILQSALWLGLEIFRAMVTAGVIQGFSRVRAKAKAIMANVWSVSYG